MYQYHHIVPVLVYRYQATFIWIEFVVLGTLLKAILLVGAIGTVRSGMLVYAALLLPPAALPAEFFRLA